MYSVKNRIDFSALSQVPRSLNIDDSLYSILPSEEEYKALKQNFAILVARTIHEHIPFSVEKNFKGLIPMHIPHQYAEHTINAYLLSCMCNKLGCSWCPS